MKIHKAILLFAIMALCAGCGEDDTSEVKPEKMLAEGSKIRTAALNASVTLKVEVLGPRSKALLGGKGSDSPAPGVAVYWEIISGAETGAELLNSQSITDAGGKAVAELKIGSKFGLVKIRAKLANRPSGSDISAITYSVIGGVQVFNNEQDVYCGTRLTKDIVVMVEREPGVPYTGIIADVDLRHAPKKSKVTLLAPGADEDGELHIGVVGGEKTGSGEFDVELHLPDRPEIRLPELRLEFFVINRWHIFLTVGGGLAIFIFGMHLMSEGLKQVAADRMRAILGYFTRNSITGMAVGCFVTGLIQSSSACTVMVVGFVNAGLMQLKQAISVVIGANIGTTVTAQMISFKLNSMAMPAIMIGMIIMLLARRHRTRFTGQILLGFGLLFLGLTEMSGVLKGLRESQIVHDIFAGFNCTPGADGIMPISGVLRGVLVGLTVTIVVQSSSASIGLLLALLSAGLLDIWTAFPILLGDNIGTTITAALASLGANRTAKQTACAHTLFNSTGTLLMLILLYIPWNGHPVFLEFVNRVTDGNAFAGENVERFLANAHSIFNVATAILLLPFVSVLASICRRVVKDRGVEEEGDVETLEPHLLGTPVLALRQVEREIMGMLGQAKEGLNASFKALIEGDSEPLDKAMTLVRQREERIDNLQNAATNYLHRISQENLTEEQSLRLPHLLHAVNDAERIGDHSVNIIKLARRSRKHELRFPEETLREMQEIYGTMATMLDEVVAAMEGEDSEKLAEIGNIEDRIDRLRKNLRKSHTDEQAAPGTDMRRNIVFLEFLTHVERVGDHLYNIAQATLKEVPTEEQV